MGVGSFLVVSLLMTVMSFFYRPNSYYFGFATAPGLVFQLQGDASYEECFWGHQLAPELKSVYEGCGAVTATSRPVSNASAYWLINVSPDSQLIVFTSDPILNECLEDAHYRPDCLNAATQERLNCLQAKLPVTVKSSCPSPLDTALLLSILDDDDDDDVDDDDW